MNPIIEKIAKNKINYCHALEVSTKYELQSVIESLFDEFKRSGYKDEDIRDFFNTLSIYYLPIDEENEEEENEVYNFNIDEYLSEIM